MATCFSQAAADQEARGKEDLHIQCQAEVLYSSYNYVHRKSLVSSSWVLTNSSVVTVAETVAAVF
jgi:hypothetical protein